MKLLVGLLKGAVIGGAVGYGAYALGNATGFGNAWLTYGLVGMLVGLLVGRPLWSLIKDAQSTSWIGVLKAAFGFGVGCGLYALIAKVWDPSSIEIASHTYSWPPVLGGVIGAVYGGFVELDDAIGADSKANDKAGKPKPKAIAANAKAKKPAVDDDE